MERRALQVRQTRYFSPTSWCSASKSSLCWPSIWTFLDSWSPVSSSNRFRFRRASSPRPASCDMSEAPKPEPVTLCAGVGRVDGVAVDEKDPEPPLTFVLMVLVVVPTDAVDTPNNGSAVIGEN